MAISIETDFYAEHSEYSDSGPYAALYEALPIDLGPLCEALQGLLIHVFHAKKYGFQVPQERMPEIQLVTATELLDALLRLDDAPLNVERPPERRLLATCRHYSLLLCSVLRSRGVPARIRCGFETYFHRDRYGDHWVAEVYDAALERWRLVDVELDALHRQAFKVGDVDITDLPPERFIVAGEMWRRCAEGQVDPARCGLLNMWGIDYVRSNVVRDALCLNKVERFPWDGAPLTEVAELSADQRALVDQLASLTHPEVRANALCELYARCPELHPRPLVT